MGMTPRIRISAERLSFKTIHDNNWDFKIGIVVTHTDVPNVVFFKGSYLRWMVESP